MINMDCFLEFNVYDYHCKVLEEVLGTAKFLLSIVVPFCWI